MRSSVLRFLSVSTFVFLLAIPNAMGYFSVKSMYLAAPSKPIEGVKRIAVLDFDGYDGRDVTDAIVTSLLYVDEGKRTVEKEVLLGRPAVDEYLCFQKWAHNRVFEVVERSRLESVLSELEFGQTGLVSEAQAAQIGDVLGVDAIIMGSTTASTDDKRTREERTVFRSKDQGGSYSVYVDCLERVASAEASFRIITPETAQILVSDKVGGSASDKYCAEEIGKVRPSEELIKDAVMRAAYQIVPQIKPRFLPFEGELEKLKAKEIKEDAAQAGELADKGKFDQAFAIYSKLLETDSYNPDLYYNLGLLEEAVGNFDKAKGMYENSVSLVPKSKLFAECVRRVQEKIEGNEKLRAYGFDPTPYAWDTSASTLAEASATRLIVRGKSTERQEVYLSPDETSDVVGQVPGGIELKVMSEEGDWCKVMLIGNKEGFIKKSKLK